MEFVSSTEPESSHSQGLTAVRNLEFFSFKSRKTSELNEWNFK